jgi:SAM-dependent methyltransferase
MEYDPIKKQLGDVFNKSPFLRKLFYKLLDLLLLRCWHIQREIKLWKKNNPSPKRILDAGMGFGQYTYYMSQLFTNTPIDAVDVKEDQVSDCTTFFKRSGIQDVNFSVADLTAYTSNQSYDLALSVDVMEHILEDVLVFKNILAVLRPGGMLLISTPSDQGGSDVSGEGEESFIGEHVRDGYGVEEIQQKLKTAGFSKTEVLYSYGWPGKISWRLSMKYPISLLSASRLFFVILPFYYLLVYPLCFLLNALDTRMKHPSGTGLIVKAWK